MAQSREQIVSLLDSIQRRPNRKLGQHFMIEPTLIDRLAAEAGLADNPLILEVGPGTGTLTESLLDAGGEVVAVEIDEFLADLLRPSLAARFPDRFHLIRGDVLEGKHRLNRQAIGTLARIAGAGGRPVRLVANLPYSIASPLLAELIDLTWRARRSPSPSRGEGGGEGRGDPGGRPEAGTTKRPAPTSEAGSLAPPEPPPLRPEGEGSNVAFDRLVFTVQREVADRLSADANNKDYGPLSVLCQGLGDVRVLSGKISPNAFYPKPNVFSAMLRIDLPAAKMAAGDLNALHMWMEAGFGHRRKTLSASIRFAPSEWQVRLTTAALAAGIDLGRRGETLSVAEYLTLARLT